MNLKSKYAPYVFVAILCFCLGGILGKMQSRVKKEIEIVEVEKVRERVRVVTRIKERPDGSKETTIIEETIKDMNRRYDKLVKEKSLEREWLVSASYAPFEAPPVYTLQVQRRILWGAYAGLYGRTDGEVGVSLSYGF